MRKSHSPSKSRCIQVYCHTCKHPVAILTLNKELCENKKHRNICPSHQSTHRASVHNWSLFYMSNSTSTFVDRCSHNKAQASKQPLVSLAQPLTWRYFHEQGRGDWMSLHFTFSPPSSQRTLLATRSLWSRFVRSTVQIGDLSTKAYYFPVPCCHWRPKLLSCFLHYAEFPLTTHWYAVYSSTWT